MRLDRFAKSLFYHGLESLGKFYSVYRGYVVDNFDPDGLNRLKVIVPTISKSPLVNWAYQKSCYSGDNYGIQILPEQGALVWVEFDHGNPKYPIWQHGHYLKDQKPKEFNHPQVYGFKSPKGQLIRIIDVDGIESIVINEGKNGGLVNVIELTEKINHLEEKLNDLITHYSKHLHEVPPAPSNPVISLPINQPSSLIPKPPTIPKKLDSTKREDIENTKVKH